MQQMQSIAVNLQSSLRVIRWKRIDEDKKAR
jgi:hypothetical protein